MICPHAMNANVFLVFWPVQHNLYRFLLSATYHRRCLTLSFQFLFNWFSFNSVYPFNIHFILTFTLFFLLLFLLVYPFCLRVCFLFFFMLLFAFLSWRFCLPFFLYAFVCLSLSLFSFLYAFVYLSFFIYGFSFLSL